MSLCNAQGQPIRLGRELGKGGEGSVFELIGHPRLVAKVYHQAVESTKAAKLRAMSQLKTEPLLRLTSWPVDTLHDTAGGEMRGILMPRLEGFREIHLLSGPRSRQQEFPQANWPFLIHTAANVTRAFKVIHDHGHVIGDVNDKNLLVSEQGTVRLIDCDSFQISSQGKQYLCGVGVQTHLPPELQGNSLRGAVRSIEHDAFGLAVVLFQLLFMGRHPFSGRFLGTGQMPLDRAIKEFRFAYGSQAATFQMQPPPGAVSLAVVNGAVASLFERAFSPDAVRGKPRPRPEEWARAIEGLARELQVCAAHPGHHYLRSLSKCPWCELEVLAGVKVFPIPLRTARKGPAFNLDAVWAQIVAVQSPGPAPPLPVSHVVATQLSTEARQVAQMRITHRILVAGLLGLLVTLAVGLQFELTTSALLLLIVAAIGYGLTSLPTPARRRAEVELSEAQRHFAGLVDRWSLEGGDRPFQAKLHELMQIRTAYLDLADYRRRRMQELQANLVNNERQKFLARQRIYYANISGIGPGRTATLRSYGIETAADVTYAAVSSIPGFGPVLTDTLLAWRRSVESHFRFNPAQGIDPQDVLSLDQEIEGKKRQYEHELGLGASALNQLAQHALTQRAALSPWIVQAYSRLSQIKADLKVL